MDTFIAIIVFMVLVVFIGLLMAFPVMLLWNYCLVGAVAGINEITWLTAWGINMLCGILFKTHTSKSSS